jgi:hypothetical protein
MNERFGPNTFERLGQGSEARIAQAEVARGIGDDEILVLNDPQTTLFSRLKEGLNNFIKPAGRRVALPASAVLLTIAAACSNGDKDRPTVTATAEPKTTERIESSSPVAGEITSEELASVILTPKEVQESIPYNYLGRTTSYKLDDQTRPLPRDTGPHEPGRISGYSAGYYASYEGSRFPKAAVFLYDSSGDARAAFERLEATSNNVREFFDAPGVGDQSQGKVTRSAVLSTTSVSFQQGRVVAYATSLDIPGSQPGFMIAMARRLADKIEVFLINHNE